MKFISKSEKDTALLAEKIAEKLKPNDFIAFFGGMGMGKTTFTRHLAKALGFTGEASSPTFAIINEYIGGRLNVYHFDMYRIDGWEDLYTTGYFEYLESGEVLVIEWSENIASALPEHYTNVVIEYIGENDRKITVEEV